jgi:nucleotide-binding universal stress UspA family protein
VLIVRSPRKELTGTLKILFATDGSEHSNSTAGILSSIPFPKKTELTILNVSFSTLYDIPDQFSIEVDSRIKNIVAGTHEEESRISTDITSKTYELLKNRFAESERITKFGDPPVEILSTADDMGADIIALGSSGKRGILRTLGSVSRYVLNHAKCSVLIGK